MNLEDARLRASWLRTCMRNGCERIEVAGSIRREKPEVKDIELVLIPRFGEREVAGQMMLGAAPPVERVNLARVQVERLGLELAQPIKPGTHEVIPWHLSDSGSYWRLWLPGHGIKVDVFLCSHETWGLNLVIRTGSADFSRAVLQRWKAISGGGRSDGLRLTWPDGRQEPTPEERDVFRACRLSWVAPRDRTSEDAVWKAAERP